MQCEILIAVVHHNNVGAEGVCELGYQAVVACDNRASGGCKQQRFVADIGSIVPQHVHNCRSNHPSAISTR